MSSDSFTAKKVRRSQFGSAALPYLLVFPTLFFVLVFTVFPTLRLIYDSLFLSNQAVQIPQFIGVGNYVALFQDEAFRQVLFNTFLYGIVTVPVSIALALTLAILLNRKLRALGLYRLAYFYPAILPMVSAASIWLFMFTPDYGLVNIFFMSLHLPNLNWLGEPNLALPALMIVGIWKQTGYLMIFYLAGLQALPQDVYEAAELDGAGPFAQARHLTLPLLTGTTLFVSTIAVLNAFQTVDQVYIMTGGGPNNATDMLLFNLWQTLFSFYDIGRANAISVILIATLLIFTISNFFYGERRTQYDH
ncbi:MAG: sugar ABC transporter permease [Chloroflexota bacterium]|nr:MAG: sugar ABC transporter permease [Chloroflexota bacterium]